MIKPTVGRIVYFFSGKTCPVPKTNGEPLAAVVAAVVNDSLLNLSVIDYVGHLHPVTNCPLVQPNEAVEVGETYCTWMPYQVAQAPSSQELLSRIDRLEAKVLALGIRAVDEASPSLAGRAPASPLPPAPSSGQSKEP